MATPETVTFEGQDTQGGAGTELTHYDGFLWTGVHALNRAHETGPPNGYQTVGSGKTIGVNDFGHKGEFGSTTQFDLKSMHAGAAWDTGLKLTFTAYDHGVKVGHKVVTLDQQDTFIKFSKAFDNIDSVTMKASGGTHGTGAGHGREIAFDDIQVLFHGKIPTGADPAHGTQLVAEQPPEQFPAVHLGDAHDWVL